MDRAEWGGRVVEAGQDHQVQQQVLHVLPLLLGHGLAARKKLLERDSLLLIRVFSEWAQYYSILTNS